MQGCFKITFFDFNASCFGNHTHRLIYFIDDIAPN